MQTWAACTRTTPEAQTLSQKPTLLTYYILVLLFYLQVSSGLPVLAFCVFMYTKTWQGQRRVYGRCLKSRLLRTVSLISADAQLARTSHHVICMILLELRIGSEWRYILSRTKREFLSQMQMSTRSLHTAWRCSYV